MGWAEIELKLLRKNKSWFIDEKDPAQWELLIKIIHKEFPKYTQNDIRSVVGHAQQSLLPPIAKDHLIEWLKNTLPEK